MIELLKGKIAKKLPTGLIIDVNGVGYRVDVPLTYLCEIPDNKDKEIETWIYTRVKEDAIQLYGFKTYNDKELFEMLLSVNKVGPRIALAILSTLDTKAIIRAVEQEQIGLFKSIPGIGPNLAGKIVLELKNKIKKLSFYNSIDQFFDSPIEKQRHTALSANDQVFADIKSALENLGFKTKDIEAVISKIPKDDDQVVEFSSTMRHVLNKLNSSNPATKARAQAPELF